MPDEEIPNTRPFGPEDAEVLLSLRRPNKATRIVLDEQCIAELKPQLESLVDQGWHIEYPDGTTLTFPPEPLFF